MSKRSQQARLNSSKNIPIVGQLFLETENIDSSNLPAVKTPRCRSIKKETFDHLKTQKLSLPKRFTASHNHPDDLLLRNSGPRENLFDLDFEFSTKIYDGCQTERKLERSNFIIRKVDNIYLKSQGKDTCTSSSTESKKLTFRVETEMEKNATDLQKTYKLTQMSEKPKRKSNKTHMKCKIVHSKKLPFEVDLRRGIVEKENNKEIELDLSMISEIPVNEDLLTEGSYQNINLYF